MRPWLAAVATVLGLLACRHPRSQRRASTTPHDGGASIPAVSIAPYLEPITPTVPTGDAMASLALGTGIDCARVPDDTVRCRRIDGRVNPITSVIADQVVTGQGFACARGRDGSAWCWGQNDVGQLGDGTHTASERPARVEGLADVIRIAAGARHACAIAHGGAVYCWGDNVLGQCGQPNDSVQSTARPMRVAGVSEIVDLAASDGHTCVIQPDHTVSCWGFGAWRADPSGAPSGLADVGTIQNAASLSAGPSHTCAATHDGAVWCWGTNEDGELGDGSHDDRRAPVQVSGLRDVASVAVGDAHSCALTRGGSVWCWGGNPSGQLGDGTVQDRVTPVRVSGLPALTSLAAVDDRTCGLDRSGQAWCWGHDPATDRAPDVAMPTPFEGLHDVIDGALGSRHACVVVRDGSVWCWGANSWGQLGDGTTLDRFAPVRAHVRTLAVAVSAGRSRTCVRDGRGRVECWGESATVDAEADPEPRTVRALREATDVGVGGSTACASTVDGAVACWNGDEPPTPVAGLSGVEDLAVGANHACARVAGGTVRCWGEGLQPETALGRSAHAARERIEGEPGTVAGIDDAVDVTAGRRFACAVRRSGPVRCWGSMLVDADAQRWAAWGDQPVAGMNGVVALAHGSMSAHVCGRTRAGDVLCAGNNERGQLGDGTFTTRAVGAAVVGLHAALQVAVGTGASCARLEDGTLRCWGARELLGPRLAGVRARPRPVVW